MRKQKIVVSVFILLLLIGIVIGYVLGKKSYEKVGNREIQNISVKTHQGNVYYIITGKYEGEYSLDTLNLYSYMISPEVEGFEYDAGATKQSLAEEFTGQRIVSYDEYTKFMNRWLIKPKYNDANKKYIMISAASIGSTRVDVRLADVVVNNNKAEIFMYEQFYGVTADVEGYVLVIPVDKDVKDYNITTTYTKEEFENIVEYGSKHDPRKQPLLKPMIYIYPEKDMEVSVKLGYPELLTTTYPKYNDGWKVKVLKDGTIKYNGREYYGLYWESRDRDIEVTDEGFVVKGEDVESFLEEKLAILGLNEREANEFIIYWLPKMEHNKYNYIRFETKEDIDNYMPLVIEPKPDSVIRIVMSYKALDEEIEVKEQKLVTPSRTGYTVVEWGGSEIR